MTIARANMALVGACVLMTVLHIGAAAIVRHKRPKPPGINYTWIRRQWHRHPPLKEMQKRFQWCQMMNRLEHHPAWRYRKVPR